MVEKVKKSIFAFAVFFSNFTDLNIVFFYFILLVVEVAILSNLMCLAFNFLCFISALGYDLIYFVEIKNTGIK